MTTIREIARDIEVVADVDVVVVGGGCAGVAAALAAARSGAKTALVERLGFLGGCATATMMDVFWMYQAGPGIPAVEGIGMEVLRRLKERGGVDGEPGWRCYVDSELLKVLYDDMMAEAGVDLWFHALGCYPVQEGNVVKGVIIESKSGRQAILSKVVVDASGDGDIAYRAGAPWRMGRESDGKVQPVSTSFRLSNVHLEGLIRYTQEHPYDLSFAELIVKARANGDYGILRDSLTLHGIRPWGDFTGINATRVFVDDPTDVKEFTRAEIECRKQVYEVANMLKKYAPGFEDSEVAYIATQAAARESRSFVGDYTLTQNDVITGATFEDAIAVSPCFTDVHSPDGRISLIGMPFPADPKTGVPMRSEAWDSGDPKSNFAVYTRFAKFRPSQPQDPSVQPVAQVFDIPYRTLVPKEIDGLLTSGRCISGDHYAIGCVRYFPISFATGQAAGAAAAMCAQEKVQPRQVKVSKLQKKLVAKGAYLQPEVANKVK